MLCVSDVHRPFPVLQRPPAPRLPRVVVAKITGARRACLLLPCRIPSTILLCPLARRPCTEHSTRECPEMGRKAADPEALGAPGDPSCRNAGGGPWGALPVTGQGRVSTGKNESPARAPGKHISCPQLFQERSFLIFCSASFFTFQHTFLQEKALFCDGNRKRLSGTPQPGSENVLCPADRKRGWLLIWYWHPFSTRARTLCGSYCSFHPGWDLDSSSASSTPALWSKVKVLTFFASVESAINLG